MWIFEFQEVTSYVCFPLFLNPLWLSPVFPWFSRWWSCRLPERSPGATFATAGTRRWQSSPFWTFFFDFCFPASLLLCFSAFLLFPAFLLFQLLCFSAFCFSLLFCFSSFSASLLSAFPCFSAFPVSLLTCFSDSLIFPPFLFLILQIILK